MVEDKQQDAITHSGPPAPNISGRGPSPTVGGMELLDCKFPWASRAVSTRLKSSARELICSAVSVGEEKTDPDMVYS